LQKWESNSRKIRDLEVIPVKPSSTETFCSGLVCVEF